MQRQTTPMLPTQILDERTSEATHREMMLVGIKHMFERTEQFNATPRWNLIERFKIRHEVLGQAHLLRKLNGWSLHDAIHGGD